MRISVLTASALPAFIAIVSFVIFGAGYGGDVGSASKVFAENFYSDNTNYLNIIKQVTDWAFFDSWKGLPFYSYSSVYANNLFSILAFSPYFLILYLLYKSRNNRGHRSTKALYLVAAGLFVFQLMLGLNNPFYKFFYQHSSAFQIFRNITKFAPLLLLMLLMAIYLLMVEMRSNRKIMIFSSVLLFLTLCYNLPYWVYSNDFYQKRIVKDIPDYWIEASTFLDTEAIPGSKALILPPTYISDTYLWNEKSNDVRGSLFDAIAETKTYRLSETMVGSAEFQVDSYNLFVRDYINPRKKKVDYNRLGDFLTKYNLNWVIITEDLLNEYQDEQDLAKWLSVQGYKIKGEFGKIALYENDKNYKPQISSNSIRYKKISNTSYLLNVSLTDSAEITFDQPANPDWQLKILPQEELDCKSWIALPDGTDKNSYCVDSRAGNNLLESIVRNRMSKHLVEQQSSMDDRIAWRVDTQEIIEKFAPEFYNSTDSGTEVTLLLVLKTQTTFWRGLFACSVIYVLCIVYSFYPIRNKQL